MIATFFLLKTNGSAIIMFEMETEELYDLILHRKKFIKSSRVYEEY